MASDQTNKSGRRGQGAARSSSAGDRLRFLRAMIRSPRQVASVTPTGRQVAAMMASHVDPASGLPVLELGPGTGPVTRAILDRGVPPGQLYLVEYEADLCAHLRQTFPGVHVINGDAFDLDATLAGIDHDRFDSVVCGVPLLNFGQPRRLALMHDALNRVPPGRPMIQITYGTKPPIDLDDPSIFARGSHWALRNLPPARVWTFHRSE